MKTHRLCQLVKPIATNIDELLNRYDNKDTVNSISKVTSSSFNTETTHSTSDKVDMIIRRLERLENQESNRPSRRKNFTKNRDRQFCVHCSLINKQLGAQLDVKHHSSSCTKKNISINVIEAMDDPRSDTDIESNEGEVPSKVSYISPSSLQINSSHREVGPTTVSACDLPDSNGSNESNHKI